MSLGGSQIVLSAPSTECVGDLILRACRRLWNKDECFFQDVEDAEQTHSLTDVWVWTTGCASKEFFVYENKKAIKAWLDGPTKANANTMLHFIIGDARPHAPGIVEVAVIFDKYTRKMKHLVEELRNAFLDRN